MSGYDFNDPYIEMMVARDHAPGERFAESKYGDYVSLGINCDHCHWKWPCPPIRELGAWRAEQKEAQGRELEARIFTEMKGPQQTMAMPPSRGIQVIPRPGYQSMVDRE